MKKFPGLVKRGDRYTYRVRVPADLVEVIGAVEIKQSLKTADPEAALLAAKKVAWDIAERFAEVRRRTPARVPKALLNAPRRWVTADEERYLVDSIVHSLLAEDDRARMLQLDYEAMGAHADQIDDLDGELRARLANGRFGGALKVHLEEALARIGVELDPDGDDYRRIGFNLMVAARAAVDDILTRFGRRAYPRTPAAPSRPEPPPPAPDARRAEPTTGRDLYAVLDKWEAERQPRGRSRYEYESFVNEFYGETILNRKAAVAALTRADVQLYKDKLLERGLNPRTIAKRVGCIKTLLKVAVDNGMVEDNVAAKVTISVPKTRKQKARLSFTDEDITALLKSPVWSAGARPAGGAGEAAWWLPVLGLGTGCRREEVAALKLAQVQERDGILFLDLTDAEVKTESSRRRVPLHPVIVNDLGFKGYVQARRQEFEQGTRKGDDGRLFPDLKPDRFGKYGNAWGKWFGRYLRSEAKVADPRKVLHSSRHWFKDACREAGISEELHDRLTGHAPGTVGGGYGEGFSLKALYEAALKIDLAGLKVAGKWSGQ